MIALGDFTTADTIPVGFDTYDSDGASVTISGLAVTDIEIYKDGSTTQRASDNGYALLDTDGIDFDGAVGLHGFSVNLADNSDAGFYADGSHYWIHVNAITVDSQTVRFTYYFTIGRLLKPTTAGRKLDVSAGGAAGVDWANVESPTSTVGLSNTTVGTCTALHSDYDAAKTAAQASDITTAHSTTDGKIDGLNDFDGTGATLHSDYDAAKTAAQAGDQMDLVDAPNSTAVTAIQSGLSTLDADTVRSAVGLASANLDTQLGDIPTVSEFEARTLAAASYFDPSSDTVTLANGAHGGGSASITLWDYSVFKATGFAVAGDAMTLTAAERNSIADAMLVRGASNIEDSADKHSLGAVVMIQTNASISDTTLTAKKPSDDSTFQTYTVTVDASADPITGIS